MWPELPAARGVSTVSESSETARVPRRCGKLEGGAGSPVITSFINDASSVTLNKFNGEVFKAALGTYLASFA